MQKKIQMICIERKKEKEGGREKKSEEGRERERERER